jgi:hypothetical protein
MLGSWQAPKNQFSPLVIDSDLHAVDDELAVLGLDVSLVLTVGRVVLEHVYHVV